MNFDYFYGEQSESYAFYRTPKVFFTDERFRGLSSDAKILYGILLDRVSMSARNKWLDEEGRVYVYMTLSSIEYSIGCCKQKAVNLLTELEEFGLIERKRQGQGKPTRVYVKNFILVWNSYLKKYENHTSKSMENIPLEVYEADSNKNNTNNNQINNNNPKVNVDELPIGEKEILRLIATRLLEAVSAPCRYIETVIDADCNGYQFKAKGKQIVDEGWKAIAPVKKTEKSGSEKDEDENQEIKTRIAAGERTKILSTECKEGKTTPPKSFTEDTLLSAMEKAGADETPDEAERKGLGTPATRAGIIEKLVNIGFIERKGDKKTKYLVPTHKGEALITVIPEAIQSASMTAEWEQKLLEVERQSYSSEQFIDEIEELIRNLIDTYEVIPDAEVLMHPAYEPIGKCPRCGKDVIEKSKGFFCSDKECKFALWKDNRFFDRKLKHMVSFELVHVEDDESRGFYRVKNSATGCERDITELSTGEKNVIAFLYFIEKIDEVKDILSIMPRVIVFDDPMSSNDDGMQYLIIEELQKLLKRLSDTDHFILLTHNKHFYLNVKYGRDYRKDRFIRFQSDGSRTHFVIIDKENDDYKTSYESLWNELKLLFGMETVSADLLLNPIRRIIETYTKFNAINKGNFCSTVDGAMKLFNVNSHSIDDVEAELNGKSKNEVIQMFYDCFAYNNREDHFMSFWGELVTDESGNIVF